MLKLTNHFKSKKPVWINSTMIQSIELFTGTRPDETYTNVMATSGATYNVIETPERIVEMMGEKKSILLGQGNVLRVYVRRAQNEFKLLTASYPPACINMLLAAVKLWDIIIQKCIQMTERLNKRKKTLKSKKDVNKLKNIYAMCSNAKEVN